MPTTLTPPSPAAPTTRRQLDELDSLLQRMLDLPVAADEGGASNPKPRTRSEPARGESATVKLRPVAATAPVPPKTNSEPAEPAGATPLATPERPAPRQSVMLQPVQADELVKLAASWQPSANTWAPLAETLRRSAEETPESSISEMALEGSFSGFNFPTPIAPPAPLHEASLLEPAPVLIPTPTAATQEVEPRSFEPESETANRPDRKVIANSVPRGETYSSDVTTSWLLLPLIAFNWIFDVGLYLVWPMRDWLRGPVGRNLLGAIGGLCLVAAAAWYGRDWFGWTR